MKRGSLALGSVIPFFSSRIVLCIHIRRFVKDDKDAEDSNTRALSPPTKPGCQDIANEEWYVGLLTVTTPRPCRKVQYVV